ncbi:OmpH family outer membrane protein [Flagellimonas sp.]|uniref:OmpH family outer membrane protein n=1 Tax=Flagellimonas sp. TaxID=2058762 RepID=UPI003B5A5A77
MNNKKIKTQSKSENNMNKLPLYISILALIAGCATFFLSLSKSELVYVDINKLIEGYERTKTEREAFNKKANTLKANVDSLMVDWQNELKTYEKERLSMTKKELDLKQELLQGKQQQINNYQQATQKQIKEEDQKMTQTIINDINDYVKEYGKKEGYRIIFGAKGSGNIMYAEDVSDLTQTILEGLNAEYLGS